MIFNHSRFQIWNKGQHPFIHNTSELLFNNPALPGVKEVEGALNFIIAVLYPNTKPAVLTRDELFDLNPSENAINDYRVVIDDGDGKSAGYRFYKKEGYNLAGWHKVNDFDWGAGAVLSAWENRTQDLFVLKGGYDDIDENGDKLTGDFAGQRIYGGSSANTNLTLSANSGDGAGAQTGFVQFTDNVRPYAASALEFGNALKPWLKGWFTSAQIASTTITSSSPTTDQISTSKANLSFGSNNLISSGSLNAKSVTATTEASFLASGSKIGTMQIFNDSISTVSNSLGLPSYILTNTVNAATLEIAALHIDDTQMVRQGDGFEIYAEGPLSLTGEGGIGLNGSVSFSSMFGNSISTGTISASSSLSAGNISVSGSSIQSSAAEISFGSNNLTTTGILKSPQVTTASGNLSLNPVGSVSTKTTFPAISATYDLGSATNLWRTAYISTSIVSGANTFTITDLMKLRDASTGAVNGASLFYDAAQGKWLPSIPDTEISHASISGLTTGDAGHTQFVMLAGRSGGQSIIGGTAASNELTLESTSSATKGFVKSKDSFLPFTDAAKDLGSASLRWKDVYTSGEMKGMRIESVAALPANSGNNVARLAYLTTDSNVYLDTGTSWKQIGGGRFWQDVTWSAADVAAGFKDTTVTGIDARLAVWQFKDVANNYEVIYAGIQATSATNVRVYANGLAAGTYRIIGV